MNSLKVHAIFGAIVVLVGAVIVFVVVVVHLFHGWINLSAEHVLQTLHVLLLFVFSLFSCCSFCLDFISVFFNVYIVDKYAI